MKLTHETYAEYVLAGDYGGMNLEGAMRSMRLTMDDLYDLDCAIIHKSDRRKLLQARHAPEWMITRYTNEITLLRCAQALLEDLLYA